VTSAWSSGPATMISPVERYQPRAVYEIATYPFVASTRAMSSYSSFGRLQLAGRTTSGCTVPVPAGGR
jgi:hypothetical protein